MAGMFGGVMLAGLALASLSGFYGSTARGSQTLPELLHLPYGVIVCAVVFLALAAFRAAEWWEQR